MSMFAWSILNLTVRLASCTFPILHWTWHSLKQPRKKGEGPWEKDVSQMSLTHYLFTCTPLPHFLLPFFLMPRDRDRQLDVLKMKAPSGPLLMRAWVNMSGPWFIREGREGGAHFTQAQRTQFLTQLRGEPEFSNYSPTNHHGT